MFNTRSFEGFDPRGESSCGKISTDSQCPSPDIAHGVNTIMVSTQEMGESVAHRFATEPNEPTPRQILFPGEPLVAHTGGEQEGPHTTSVFMPHPKANRAGSRLHASDRVKTYPSFRAARPWPRLAENIDSTIIL